MELEHPADLWLEIRADDLPRLFENALYALYAQIVDLRTVRPDKPVVLRASGDAVESALRQLLAEALFLFETEGFLAAGGQIDVVKTPNGSPGLNVEARLQGEDVDRARHDLLTEIKAVTYHQLKAEQMPDDTWRATVLLDV